MTDILTRLRDATKDCRPCFCVGPQNGEPECQCRMRDLGIFKRDGHWVRPDEPERDLGPVYDVDSLEARMAKEDAA